jgi:predicted phage baseplate assembly protein
VYGLAQGGVPVEEGRLITGEVLGTATAAPNQRYPLARPRILLGPPGAVPPTAGDVRVVTRLAGVVTVWTRKESLAFSEAGQLDYVVEVDADDKATVVFGDGRFGVIPDAGATVEASYRVGGGPGGNVLADTVTTIANAAQLSLLGATVTNPVPATGGADREDIAHAVQQAPAVFRSLRRAVTAADYEALALSFKGVGKVRAVATGWNEVTLFVAPEGGGKVSDVLELGLKAFFEDKRMLTQVVEVSDVDYVPIKVTAQIAVENFFVTADVVAQVQKAAADLLAFDRVTFNQTLYLSRFYEDSQQIPGVVFVNVTEFRRADSTGPPIDPLGKIVLGPNEVPVIPTDLDYAAGMKVEVVPRGGR